MSHAFNQRLPAGPQVIRSLPDCPELVAFQLFAMSAQSRARGNVLINPGAFSLYRADLIREIVPAYLDETFFGCPVTLGDDTALAKCLGPAQPARTGR